MHEKNLEKINNFCKRILEISLEISNKKEPCECTFKIYFDSNGIINSTPTEIIHKKFLI